MYALLSGLLYEVFMMFTDNRNTKQSVMQLFGNRSLSFKQTLVMGIINITSDSFYECSRVNGVEQALERAIRMISDGADIIDIGAESTRPGAKGVTVAAELDSIIPVIEAIRRTLPQIPISIDTRKAAVAAAAIKAGADIINDVSGLELSEEQTPMLTLLKESGAPYILTHTKGTPDVMQNDPEYDNFTEELMGFFNRKIELLSSFGVRKDRIIIDPGLGFGKRYEDNIAVIANLDELKAHGYPVLIGASRKTFISEATLSGEHNPLDCLEGTLAISSLCSFKNIDIVRVHDIKENKRAIMMINAVRMCKG